MTEPIVITMDTNPNDEALRFLKTLTTQGWKYRLVGTDEKWVSFLHRSARYLEELKIIAAKTPDRVCVIADCRDVLCVRTPLSFMDAFNTFEKDIVVSGEFLCGGDPIPKPGVNCTDLKPYWESIGYNNEDLPIRRFVNAGLIAGKAGALVQMYLWMVTTGLDNKMYDDQVLMGKYINAHPEAVQFDIDAEMLHTSGFGASCGYISRFQQYDSPSIAEILGRRAFFLHIPGAIEGQGNKIVYDMVSLLIDKGYTNQMMLDTYTISEWGWKKYKFNQ
jgi:hypothetical protein